MKRYYYGYSEFLNDTITLAKELKGYNPDTIVAVARGGLTIAHFLAQSLNLRELFTLNSIHYENDKKLDTIEIFNIPNLNSAKKVVIVDDIVDSGDTLKAVVELLQSKYPNCQFKIATLFYKPTALITPDYTIKEAKEWIDFFWETDPILAND